MSNRADILIGEPEIREPQTRSPEGDLLEGMRYV